MSNRLYQDRVSCEVYEHFYKQCHSDEKAHRRLRRAQARHTEHNGKATISEQRDVWDLVYTHGPSLRPLQPDRFALFCAMQEDVGLRTPSAWQDGRPELAHWDALGLDGEWRERLSMSFFPYYWEAQEPIAAGRIYDRERLARMLCAKLPGMLARVDTVQDMARLLRTLRSMPDWVWQAWQQQDELRPLRYLQPEELAALRESQGLPPLASGWSEPDPQSNLLPAADLATADEGQLLEAGLESEPSVQASVRRREAVQ